VLITIGSVTGVSITALFTGGLLPSAVLGVMLCTLVWWRTRRDDVSGAARLSGRAIGRAFVIAIPALVLPFVIRAAVIDGVATATEVSTIGIAYTIVAGLLIYRRLPIARLVPMLVSTAALSGAILLIIGAAIGMAWALTQSGFSNTLAAAMRALPGGAPVFLLVSAAAFIVLGSVLAIVFGAGSVGEGWGNGKATATLFAREGASVVCVDIKEAAAAETVGIITQDGGKAFAATCDVTVSEQVRALVDRVAAQHGRIDVLHNNVG
jgi:TRAP-type mannitol/chloroaromatic compound transport system permease large subunit